VKHKHAEVLMAIAEGKDVQFFNDGLCVDYIESMHASPLAGAGYQREWRVKPQPKPDVVSYDYARVGFYKTIADVKLATTIFDCKTVTLKFTQDGETGKLKSAEVLK